MNELKVLNKGLGFVPSHFIPKYCDIDNDIKRFERKLQLHFFFAQKGLVQLPEKNVLQKNSNWWPKKLNGHITKFCYDIKRLIFEGFKHTGRSNLPPKEISALKSLSSNRSIVVKKCDKGGGIAVMNRQDYMSRINNMLNDKTTYSVIDSDDSTTVKSRADEIIFDLADKGILNHKQVMYLTQFNPRCPIFYGLPKIHKENHPLRPIVSQIDGPTCRINELVDKYLYVAEKNIPMLLQDTTAFLRVINEHKKCIPGALLVTMDVSSLYTNIPHDEGNEWVCDYYEETLDRWGTYAEVIQPVDRDSLSMLTKFILDNCTFEFDGTFYRQNYGTTMGAKFSVKFANIYMYMWFRKFNAKFNGPKPDFIARLIDDCFFIWNESKTALNQYVQYINNCHVSIKFECISSADRVTFLDTITYVENNEIRTTIYTKPTDKKQYLYYTSNHPRHIFRSVPYSQCIRYRRIIEDDGLLATELSILKSKFMNRCYPADLIDGQFSRAINLKRMSLLKYKTVEEKRANFDKFLRGKTFLPLIVAYHQSLSTSTFKTNFIRLWNDFIHCKPDITAVFNAECPQIVFKRGRTIANVLVRTKISTVLCDLDR